MNTPQPRQEESPNDQHPGYWKSRTLFGFCVLAAVAVFFLWSEHRAHIMGALPYVLLLACPLMHVFMHRGHRSDVPQGRSSGDQPH